MKFLLPLLFSLSLSTYAQEECDYPVMEPLIPVEQAENLKQVSNAIKKDFKRRAIKLPGFINVLSIETNFDAPIIGKDTYWGKIYIRDGQNDRITYRDDVIAERHYNEEKKNPDKTYYTSSYNVAEINSAKGLSLIKAAGADVKVKSPGGKFSTKTGGRLVIDVKAPNESPKVITMDVVRKGKSISKSVVVGDKKIPFDNFKINASKNFLGITTILSGIQSIQFFSNGKVVHTIN